MTVGHAADRRHAAGSAAAVRSRPAATARPPPAAGYGPPPRLRAARLRPARLRPAGLPAGRTAAGRPTRWRSWRWSWRSSSPRPGWSSASSPASRSAQTGEDGDGLALAGIIVGGIVTAIFVLIIVFWIVAFAVAASYALRPRRTTRRLPGDPGSRRVAFSGRAHSSGGVKDDVRVHAGRPALAGDDQGHLAAGLVDHLVAEHRRALLAAGLRRRPVVGVEDQLGVVVVLLGRRVDLVGRVDLAGVQHPLAVEARASPSAWRPPRTPARRAPAGTGRRSPARRGRGRP